MKLKIYLAARYSRNPEMRACAADLDARGHTVTSRWILGDHELRSDGHSDEHRYSVQWAYEDWDDLLAADTVVSFTEAPGHPGRNRGGRHVEFGMALALGKPCLLVGPREHVFHYLPGVAHYDNWPACLDALSAIALEVPS